MARPREFDPDATLEKAMHVFWQNGYEGTSMTDLVEQTGVHRGSLYGTFGNKEQIFLAALARYGKTYGLNMLRPVLESDRPVAALKKMIWDRYDDYVAGRNTCGCLLGNTLAEVSPADKKVFAQIAELLEMRGEMLEQALRRAKKIGELKSQHDPVALARYLNTFLLGLALHVRLQPDSETMRDTIETGLSVLD